MIPLAHPIADSFLLGFTAACSFVAALFFFRFWRATNDALFMAFAFFFCFAGSSNLWIVTLTRPNEGSIWLSFLRFVAILPILAAIYWKNSSRN